MNETRVHQVLQPTTADELSAAVIRAGQSGRAISVAGGRHAMGSQQFGTGNLHLDTTKMNQILYLDSENGSVSVEAGINWPTLIQGLHELQSESQQPWTIREKQTGVDDVTIGGSISSNVHGRGLAHPPIVNDVISFELVDANGSLRTCSRTENTELFSLAIGGYGLFGLIYSVTLKLVRRFKVRRVVEIIAVSDLLTKYQQRMDQGFVFGDCQYSANLSGPAEEHPGVFPCYEPVDFGMAITQQPKELTGKQWARLYRLMRTDKQKAFTEYADHYLETDGQIYWSDTHQLAGNFTQHRDAVDANRGTEMITEVYLRHDQLMDFFAKIRDDMRERDSDITYGTIRFIEADAETFLPWAREKSVCVVCNLHVLHTDAGIKKAKSDFLQIIDRTIEFGGNFYLTYHQWATPQQVVACYPLLPEFFRLKKKHDPQQIFQSEWYRHYAPHLSQL